jgi:hypothetical protein
LEGDARGTAEVGGGRESRSLRIARDDAKRRADIASDRRFFPKRITFAESCCVCVCVCVPPAYAVHVRRRRRRLGKHFPPIWPSCDGNSIRHLPEDSKSSASTLFASPPTTLTGIDVPLVSFTPVQFDLIPIQLQENEDERKFELQFFFWGAYRPRVEKLDYPRSPHHVRCAIIKS